MPELPDVEGWKRYVARYAEGRRVRGVRVQDPRVLRNTSPQGLGRALGGARLGHPRRHGKWLVIPAGRGHLVMHFGMTGGLSWSAEARASGDRDCVAILLDGGELRYQALRRLGGVWWVSPRDEVSDVIGELGPDAAAMSREEFRERVAGRRGSIKSTLMNQAVLAGIGNELSDEILWLARVRPAARVSALAPARIDAVHGAMCDVLRRAMRHGRIPTTEGWLNAVRGAADPTCPRCGAGIVTKRIGGRTTYWCPRCQT